MNETFLKGVNETFLKGMRHFSRAWSVHDADSQSAEKLRDKLHILKFTATIKVSSTNLNRLIPKSEAQHLYNRVISVI